MFGYLWISKREWARHQRELNAAFKRASDAEAQVAVERERGEMRVREVEQSLAAERQSKDWLTLQLASRLVTKSGQYGLDHERPQKAVEAGPTPHPSKFIREPTPDDEARLNYYKQCYKEAGRSEEEAEQIWETEMRGEQPRYPYEEAEMEQ